jgi:Ribonuclease G/E
VGERRAYLDHSPGETRAVVTLDGLPERLLIAREGDATPRLGAQYAGRVRDVSDRLNLARVDLGEGLFGSLRLRSGEARPHQGAALRVEIVSEPYADKSAGLTVLPGSCPERPQLLFPAPDLKAQLSAFAPGAVVREGEAARAAADLAQEAALCGRHRLTDGLLLAIEPTAALVAVDADLNPTAVTPISEANRQAIAETARLLRLKALAGLCIIDLIGFPKDHRRLLEVAREAFAPDGPQVALGQVSRFGALDLAKPHRLQPVAEQLCDSDGRVSARTAAQILVRALERQARHEPGRRLGAPCSPDVAAHLRPLAARLGPLFEVREDHGVPRGSADIIAL